MLWRTYYLTLMGDANADDKQTWINLGYVILRSASLLLRSPDFSVADRQKVQAAVKLIKSIVQCWLNHHVQQE